MALDEARFKIKASHIVSEQPVEVRFLQGKLNANRLEVQQSGAVVRFNRGVTMVIEDTEAIIRTTADKRSVNGKVSNLLGALVVACWCWRPCCRRARPQAKAQAQ